MKRFSLMLLSALLVFVFTLTGCGQSEGQGDDATGTTKNAVKFVNIEEIESSDYNMLYSMFTDVAPLRINSFDQKSTGFADLIKLIAPYYSVDNSYQLSESSLRGEKDPKNKFGGQFYIVSKSKMEVISKKLFNINVSKNFSDDSVYFSKDKFYINSTVVGDNNDGVFEVTGSGQTAYDDSSCVYVKDQSTKLVQVTLHYWGKDSDYEPGSEIGTATVVAALKQEGKNRYWSIYRIENDNVGTATDGDPIDGTNLDSDPNSLSDQVIAQFNGSWRCDSSNLNMTVSYDVTSNNFIVDIEKYINEESTGCWELTASYDSAKGLVYSDCKYIVYTAVSGSPTKKELKSENGSGSLVSDNGKIIWNDTTSGMKNISFVKAS